MTEDDEKTAEHGAALARKALELTSRAECSADRVRIERQHCSFASELRAVAGVSDVRVCGTILACNVLGGAGSGYLSSIARGAASFFLERGVLLRPLGDVLYVLPPYCTAEKELEDAYGVIKEFLEKRGV